MGKIRIKLDDVSITIGSSSVVLAPRRPRGRFRRRHFTAHYDPRDWQGVPSFTPHVTGLPTGRLFFAFTEAEADAFAEAFGQQILSRWIAASRPVDLGELTADGWSVLLPDDNAMAAWARSRLRDQHGAYRPPDDDAWLELCDLILRAAVPPAALEGDRSGKLFTAVRDGGDGSGESCFLSHYPLGLAGGAAGWYAAPVDWLPREEIQKIMNAAPLTRVVSALAMILGLLGVPLETGGDQLPAL